MAEDTSKCETSINSIVRLDVSRRDLIKLRDRIGFLVSSIRALDEEQAALQKRLAEVSRDAAMLKSQFETLFEDEIIGIDEALAKAKPVDRKPTEPAGPAEPSEKHQLMMHTPEQITLGVSEVTREQILSIMDAIKKVSDESGGPASKEAVLSRAEEIGINRREFDEILARLRRAGALNESEGMIRLI